MTTESESNSGSVSAIWKRWNALSRIQRLGLGALVVAVLAAVPFVTDNEFLLNTLIFIFLFIVMGHGWNIIGGYAGQFSLGHAVMFAVGAYTTTVLFVYYNVTPYVGIPVGGLVATAVGVALGVATFRLRYHYFAMATLAAALIGKTIGFRWDYINGASGIEYPFAELGTTWSMMFSDKLPYYYIIGVMALVTTLLIYRMDRSKLGMYLRAIDRKSVV